MWRILIQRLRAIDAQHPDVVLASSLAAEDLLILHAMREAGIAWRVITLDTGYLPPETKALLPQVERRYGVVIERLQPDTEAVVAFVSQHGTHPFYESRALRQACCALRKVAPLRAALRGHSAWVTGQRREQARSRRYLSLAEFDTAFGLQKFNPLADWPSTAVWQEIRAREIPYNPLHDRGYPSIGCEPCTRAVRSGEDPRAGRWWWESTEARECGLHAGNLVARAE